MRVGTLIPSLTPLQAQVDDLVGQFTKTALDWKSLAALTAGGMAYRAGRLGLVSSGSPITRVLSIGAGLGSEVSAFELTHRTLHPKNSNLWRWNGSLGLKTGLLSSFITFGSLKSAGSFAQGENILVQHFFQDTGMVLAHQASGHLGLSPKPRGSLAEQFLYAEATTLQVGAGMALAHSMAPSLVAVERGLDLSLRTTDVGARSPRPGEGTSPLHMQPAFAAGGHRAGNSLPILASEQKGPDRSYMVGKSDASYPGIQMFPATFKNGELLSVKKTSGIPEGIAIVRVPEEKNHLKPEDAIAQTIEAHVNRFKRRSRKVPEPFMVYYGGNIAADATLIRQRIQNLFGEAFPEGFLIVVVMPHAPVPMAYPYRKKRGGMEIQPPSQVQLNLQSPFLAAVTKHAPPADDGSRGQSTGSTPLPGEVSRSGGSNPALKAAERGAEPLKRSETGETLSDVIGIFGRLLETFGSGRKDVVSGSWFINLTRPFIELKPDELELLSNEVTFEPMVREARGTLQNHIHQQIQRHLIERLAVALKEHPLPLDQIINIRWTEPLPAAVKIQAENDRIRVSVSGNRIPVSEISLRQSPLTREIKFDVSRRDLSSNPFADSSERTTALPSEPAARRGPEISNQNLIPCRTRDEAMEAFVRLMKERPGVSAVIIEIRKGAFDSTDLPFLGDVLNETPLPEGKEIKLAWHPQPNGQLSGYFHIQTRHGRTTANLYTFGSPMQTFALVMDPTTHTRRFHETSNP